MTAVLLVSVDTAANVPVKWKGYLLAGTLYFAATLCDFTAIERIGAADASLISLSGPAITVTAAWLLLAESLATLQCAGLGIVVDTRCS